ncbi:hypothetical protein SUGI_0329130 [Cryptomeria japonica]|nr:hypothetical protein SUGI_0329130 [Cryptomeria japonica]
MAEKRIQAPPPSSSSSKKRVQVVKYVETLFVETDAANFKAVVQSLTGQEPQKNEAHVHVNGSALVKIFETIQMIKIFLYFVLF